MVKRDGPLVITPTVQHAPKPIVEQKREQVAKLDTLAAEAEEARLSEHRGRCQADTAIYRTGGTR